MKNKPTLTEAELIDKRLHRQGLRPPHIIPSISSVSLSSVYSELVEESKGVTNQPIHQ